MLLRLLTHIRVMRIWLMRCSTLSWGSGERRTKTCQKPPREDRTATAARIENSRVRSCERVCVCAHVHGAHRVEELIRRRAGEGRQSRLQHAPRPRLPYHRERLLDLLGHAVPCLLGDAQRPQVEPVARDRGQLGGQVKEFEGEQLFARHRAARRRLFEAQIWVEPQLVPDERVDARVQLLDERGPELTQRQALALAHTDRLQRALQKLAHSSGGVRRVLLWHGCQWRRWMGGPAERQSVHAIGVSQPWAA
eukprot:3343153-Prymnesium_polylepis.1